MTDPKSSCPKISIIIPNLHSPIIDRTIYSLLTQQTESLLEIIVVGMDKWGLVNQFADKITIINTANPTPPAIARNMGVETSTGDLICFIDADCVAPPNWIENHRQSHSQAGDPIVVGGGVDFPRNHYLTLADNVSSFHEFMIHMPPSEKDFLPSLNLSLPKNVWDLVGGFNPKYPFPSGEDADLTLRIKAKGVSIKFDPKAYVEHHPNRHNFSALFTHAYRFGKYSIKANPDYWQILFVPLPLRHWFLTILSAPFLSTLVILKMVFKENLPVRFWHTLPIIYLLKLAWCLGFAAQIKSQKLINKKKS